MAEGGALLRRYTGLNPYRGFESLSLRHCLAVTARTRLWAACLTKGMRSARFFSFLLLGALVAFASDGWAARLRGTGRPAAAPVFVHPHHFHRGTVFIGGAFVGASFWPYYYYPYPPPYYYGPDYVPRYEVPGVYVERFDGSPTPDTPGEIFCPSAGAYYPDVQECQGGWQRVLRAE